MRPGRSSTPVFAQPIHASIDRMPIAETLRQAATSHSPPATGISFDMKR